MKLEQLPRSLESRLDAELDGPETRFIGRAALLQNKENTGRHKDLADADELRKRIAGN